MAPVRRPAYADPDARPGRIEDVRLVAVIAHQFSRAAPCRLCESRPGGSAGSVSTSVGRAAPCKQVLSATKTGYVSANSPQPSGISSLRTAPRAQDNERRKPPPTAALRAGIYRDGTCSRFLRMQGASDSCAPSHRPLIRREERSVGAGSRRPRLAPRRGCSRRGAAGSARRAATDRAAPRRRCGIRPPSRSEARARYGSRR